jgi:hypothetical protein
MALGWLKTGTGLALAVVAAFVMIHPHVNLVQGIFQREQEPDQDLTSASAVELDGSPVVAATAPLDTTPVSTVFRPESLEVLYVRLC